MPVVFESWLLDLFTLVVTLSTALYLYFTLCSYRHWKRKGVPYLAPSFPFGNLGDVLLQRKTMSENFDSIYRRLEGHAVGGFYQVNRPTLMVRDPELVRAILVGDFAHFQDHGVFYDEASDPLSANLFFMEGIRWRHMRQKVSPSFSSARNREMFGYVVECGEELRVHLAPFARRNDTIEVHDIAARYTTDVIATCGFGIQSNSLRDPDSEFRTMGRAVFEPTLRSALRNLLIFMAPQVGALVKLPIVTRDVSNFFIDIVKETVDYRERSGVTRNDVLQLLIDTMNNRRGAAEENGTNADAHGNMYDVKGLTVEEIAAQVFLFFTAGFETSSTTICLCLYELALNQGIQDRLRDELDETMAEHGGQLTYDAVLSMGYMDRVVSETLRKYPTFPFLVRVCTKEYQLPGSEVKIGVGTGVVIPTLALHHDPRYYPNPEEFDPGRFEDEVKKGRHRYVYLPFGEGPRICIVWKTQSHGFRIHADEIAVESNPPDTTSPSSASKFGQMQVKVAIASFIANFKVSAGGTTAIPLVMDPASFFLAPKDGVKLTISERS